MDANQLMYYMRGVFENVKTIDDVIVNNLRTEVLSAKPVEAQIIPVEVVNPMKRSTGDCSGCSGHT